MKMKLFQIAILLHPEEKKDNKEKTTIIGELKTMLAADDKQAGILAARAIPEEHVDKLDRIEVIVRPF